MLLSFISAFIGFAFLSMAMKRHYKQLWPNGQLSISKVFILRLVGVLLLIASVVTCIKSFGIGIGLVYWCGLLTFAALLQAMLLTYSPLFLIRFVNKNREEQNASTE